MKCSVIIVSGGVGRRMGTDCPKQYLILKDKAVVLHSFALFDAHPQVSEIIVVCAPEYRSLFEEAKGQKPLIFAEPGPRRQDSVYNGLKEVSSSSELVSVHDAARPLITADIITRSIKEGATHGAAVVGMPLAFTLKETHGDGFVAATVDRSRFWEIQTPQVIQKSLLEKGFVNANEKQLNVTDDVSLVEHLGLPVKLVEGSPDNLKITTPKDLIIATNILENR